MTARKSPLDRLRALGTLAGVDVDALLVDLAGEIAADAPKAGAQVVVSPAPAPVSEWFAEKVAARPLCAWIGAECLQTSGARKGKVHTFTPKSIGRWTHTSCAQGRKATELLAQGKITEEALRAGKVKITLK